MASFFLKNLFVFLLYGKKKSINNVFLVRKWYINIIIAIVNY